MITMQYTWKQLFTILLMSAALLSACSSENEEVENGSNGVRLMPVKTVTMVSGDFEDYIRLSGTVEAIDDATISSESSGRILSMSSRGDQVRRGDIIARLDDRVIRSQYDASKTAYDLAEDTFNRLESLYADSIISTQDFRSARAQRDQAKAQLELTNKQLLDSQIAAAFDGRVEERFVRVGELVNPGQPVVRLVNTNHVRILAGIPERFSGEITEGSEVEIHIRALGIEPIRSRIAYSGNVIDPDTRTYTIEVEIDNTDGLIKPEMIVDLQIKRSTLQDVLIIPRTAVLRDEDGMSVFISRVENGIKSAELVDVSTGLSSGPVVQILSGLEEGDEVVVSGMRSLSIGDQLNVIQTETSLERAVRLSQNRPVGAQ
jgi:membrane fusion protein (multidrug efflux system)